MRMSNVPWALASRSRAGLVSLALLGATCGGDNDRTAADLLLPNAPPAVVTGTTNADLAALREECGTHPDHIVFISDFQYTPPNLTVRVGETVAWVNVEECGDMAAEALAIPLAGCDNHHQVVTTPIGTGIEGIDSGPICAPTNGAAPPEGAPGPAIDTRSCADEGASNVFCHTFREPGTQHYSCFTNPAHTVLMHGVLTVTE